MSTARALRGLALLAAFALAGCDEEEAEVPHAFHGEWGPMRLVTMGEQNAGDRDAYEAVGRSFCPPGSKCQVLFFDPASAVSIPPSQEAMAARVAEFYINPLTGQTYLTFNCDHPLGELGNCL